jgi:ribonuclease E
MLIDATHPGETRVVVVSNGKVEEFDYETAAKAQLKGNIYLAKVTKVEPSLQAAFVDYGGNRHGFLPFSEIHPDYYRIPIADREALLAEEETLRAKAEDIVPAEEIDETGHEADEGERAEDPEAEEAERRTRRRTKAARRNAEENGDGEGAEGENGSGPVEEIDTEASVDTVGGDEVEEAARRRAKLMRRYKIQEVIKRKQVMLVQVTKEERGTKGAALTTYLSLAGRYCVLMPNTAKGGGISRKIGNAADRKRLKSVLNELDIPEGMAVIVRTAGAQRTKAEIRRDYEYLMRLWDEIRTKTLDSTAPALINEEANLIKRAIRDLYTRDTEEILVEGEEGYKAAKAFMKMLMPSHARHVKHYTDPQIPLAYRYEVEQQLDLMHEPEVRLKSGGSIVINPTEALVAIDVNSGKATKERHIEETALKTNLEAADEVARQLRLRDFAGLIVIDFIDMEEPRHNREVERRLKEAMKADRARIQLGRISPFGLLELSRQRLRPSLFETETEVCKVCHGTGFRRSDSSASLHVLRTVTEEAIKRGGGELVVTVPTSVALYLLNERRAAILDLEQRYGLRVSVRADEAMLPPTHELKRLSSEGTPPAQLPSSKAAALDEEDEVVEEARDEDEEEERSGGRDERRGRRGRRGGRRRRPGGEEAREARTENGDEETASEETASEETAETREAGGDEEGDEERKATRRRRGKRGGRRRSKTRDQQAAEEGEDRADDQSDDRGDDGGDDRTDDRTDGEAPAETEGTSEAEAKPDSESAPESEEAAAPTSEAEAAPEAADSSAPAPEKEAPKRRPRRARRKPAAAETEAESKPDAEPAAPDEAPAPVAASDAPAPSATEAEAEAAPASEAEAADETPERTPEPVGAEASGSDAEAEESNKPRKRGWWNRIVG